MVVFIFGWIIRVVTFMTSVDHGLSLIIQVNKIFSVHFKVIYQRRNEPLKLLVIQLLIVHFKLSIDQRGIVVLVVP